MVSNFFQKSLIKRILLFSCSVVICACIGIPTAQAPAAVPSVGGASVSNAESLFEANFWNTAPSGGYLCFIGSSPSKVKEADAIKSALEDAAKKVAVFQTVEGTLTTSLHTGNSVWDYVNDSTTELVYASDYQKYTEDLVYDEAFDVIRVKNAVFVKTRYKAALPSGVSFRRQNSGEPSWIMNPPTFKGYVTGVGYASSRTNLSNTVWFSFENTVLSIIKDLSATISNDYQNRQGGGAFDYRVTSGNTIYAHGMLNNFYVLDTWLDPKTNGHGLIRKQTGYIL